MSTHKLLLSLALAFICTGCALDRQARQEVQMSLDANAEANAEALASFAGKFSESLAGVAEAVAGLEESGEEETLVLAEHLEKAQAGTAMAVAEAVDAFQASARKTGEALADIGSRNAARGAGTAAEAAGGLIGGYSGSQVLGTLVATAMAAYGTKRAAGTYATALEDRAVARVHVERNQKYVDSAPQTTSEAL